MRHSKEHHGHHAHGGHVHEMVKKHSMHSHKHRSHHAKGGKVEEGEIYWDDDKSPQEVYAGKDSQVIQEAKAKGATRKHGGRTKHNAKHLEMHGHHAHHRLDRPARKTGGGVHSQHGMPAKAANIKSGAEKNPFSAASAVKTPAGRDVDPGEW